MNKFLDLPGLQHVLGLVKTKFVQKESGKGLSSNDFTDDEKTKLSTLRTYGVATSEEAGLLSSNNLVKLNAIEEGAEKNIIKTVKRNGTLVNVLSGEVDINVPTKFSELVNDNDLTNKTQVAKMISEARHMKTQVLTEKPTKGEANIIYLIGPKGSGNNIYEEWLYVNDKWEKVGDTDTKVDLTGYIKEEDIQSITNTEINQAMGD